MRSEVFAENVVIADAQSGRRVLVLDVLGRVTYDAARMKFVLYADRRDARKIDVRPNQATGSYIDALVDDSIGPDFDSRIHLRSWVHNSSGVDHGAASSHAVAALSSRRWRLQIGKWRVPS